MVEVADPDRGDRGRFLGQEIIHDRKVVDRQVPDHVDVVLEQAEVDPDAVEVKDVADLAGADDVLDLVHRAVIDEDVVDHELEFQFLRDIDQLLGVLGIGRDRLLDENVLAVLQGIFGERKMTADRRGDGHGGDFGIIQNFVEIRRRFDRIALLFDEFKAGFVDIAAIHTLHLPAIQKIPNQVRTPVTDANHSDFHMYFSLYFIINIENIIYYFIVMSMFDFN